MRKPASLICILILLVSVTSCIVKPEIRVITDADELSSVTDINLEDYGIHTNQLNITEIEGFTPVEISSADITCAFEALGIGSDQYLMFGENEDTGEVLKIQYGDDFYVIFTKYATVEAAHEAFIYNFYNDVIYWEENNLFDGNIREAVDDTKGYFTLDGAVGSGIGPSETYYGVFYQYENITLMVLNNENSTERIDSYLAELGLGI